MQLSHLFNFFLIFIYYAEFVRIESAASPGLDRDFAPNGKVGGKMTSADVQRALANQVVKVLGGDVKAILIAQTVTEKLKKDKEKNKKK